MARKNEAKALMLSGITWKDDCIQDVEILADLPPELLDVLKETNGFILHDGALHVRGATLIPEWHSLRAAWRGPNAFQNLYDDVRPSDISFAQDQMGDQFLIRQGAVFRLSGETGEIEFLAENLQDFFNKVSIDIETYLNVGLRHVMEPGELLLAAPPFCLALGTTASLKALAASEVILFHADFAGQIQKIPDGGKVELRIPDN